MSQHLLIMSRDVLGVLYRPNRVPWRVQRSLLGLLEDSIRPDLPLVPGQSIPEHRHGWVPGSVIVRIRAFSRIPLSPYGGSSRLLYRVYSTPISSYADRGTGSIPLITDLHPGPMTCSPVVIRNPGHQWITVWTHGPIGIVGITHIQYISIGGYTRLLYRVYSTSYPHRCRYGDWGIPRSADAVSTHDVFSRW